MRQKERALVTGALGFIGSHVTEKLLNAGIEVFGIDDLSTGTQTNEISGANYFISSLLSDELESIVSQVKPQYVFHLAALPRIQPSFERPLEHDEANVDATIKLLSCVKGKDLIAFVNSSSASIYGNPLRFPISETEKADPLSPYAIQKYTAERYIKILGDNWQIPNVSLRYFNPFGERSFNSENRESAYSPVLGVFENQIRKFGEIQVTGDGLQSRDFVYVGDVAHANLAVARNIQAVSGQVFNVCSGSVTSILDIAKAFGVPIKHIPERRGEARISWGNPEKLISATGWKTSIGIEDYIKNLI
jgi:UDP-glucose 4-epimerase